MGFNKGGIKLYSMGRLIKNYWKITYKSMGLMSDDGSYTKSVVIKGKTMDKAINNFYEEYKYGEHCIITEIEPLVVNRGSDGWISYELKKGNDINECLNKLFGIEDSN